MRSRLPILPGIALLVLVLLVVLWAFAPATKQDDHDRVVRAPAHPTMALLKDRALPKQRPLVEESNQPPPSEGETPIVAGAGEEATPTRQRVSKRHRLLERKRMWESRRQGTPAIVPEAVIGEDSGVGVEGLGGPSSGPRPTIPPDSPYRDLTDDERLELVVALQRLRDSGAIRRVDPQDYLHVMEIMPDSQGLQDADRIFREILGMGVGEWLAKSRGGETFILE